MSDAATPARLPPVWRDGWAWLVGALVLLLFFVGRGIPFGEPALDDFDYLYDTLFRNRIDWFDGCGSPLYWRPVSRQLYYLLITPFAVTHPWMVAAIQAVLLAVAGVLLYRALRPAWTAPMAAAATSFPIALVACVQLLTYSSCAQDLLALVFGAATLHGLSRGRVGLALLWLALALLSKESSAAFAATMPLWPGLIDRSGKRAGWRPRMRIAVAAGALVLIWWVVHGWVSRHAGLVAAPRIPGASALEKLVGGAARIGFETLNVGDPRSSLASWVPLAVLIVTLLAAGLALRSAAGRTRLRAALPWLGWAAVWTALAAAPTAWYMPSWGSYRAVLPAVGLGIGLVALLGSFGPFAVGLVCALRLVALLLAPPVPDRIPLTFAGTTMEFDLVRLGVLQKLAHEARVLVTQAGDELPPGARVVRYQWPRMSEMTFVGQKAFRVWCRDSTLRVVSMAEVQQNPITLVDLAVGFEPYRDRQVARIAPRALRAVLMATDSLQHGRPAAAERLLADFEFTQADTNETVFLATGLALRGAALLAQNRVDEAAVALRSALRSFPDDLNAHRLLAEVHVRRGESDLAVAELQRHLQLLPGDAEALRDVEALLRRGR